MRGKCKKHPDSNAKESGAKRARQAIYFEQKLDVICHVILGTHSGVDDD